ncbi:MAG: DUF736 family protein [Caulobacteraceae bacterium]|nr:DUF736 family protein [Caulobacteraceae bacterium]
MTQAPILLSAGFASLALASVSLAPPAPWLVWNATASTPVGLYALRAPGAPRPGELVAVRPPEPVARFLAAGGFLPRGGLLLKPVAALPGQTVCRDGDTVRIDGRRVGAALDRDHLGRPLPRWQGCRSLRPGEIFVMNPAIPQSLDGRYFGPLPAAAVVGRALPIWTQARRAGRLGWRLGAAPTSVSPRQSRRFSMATIGQFTRDPSGFSGRLRTLLLERPLSLTLAEPSESEAAPDYRVRLTGDDGPDVGAAWKRKSDKAGDYLSLLIDDPSLPAPISANLFQSTVDRTLWLLTWSRNHRPNTQGA